ncbi:OsmC family peroxiredoxin [Actinoplanes sp. DH11]|uniref:OsmC family peroxiredoxin n=1 Tax=Actinoplanes sp. DH11 TaxID=2857011 RepID=UPI001E43EB07|nr:OsmC family peroxiredoxin [Actinoplanes sp. DH11]
MTTRNSDAVWNGNLAEGAGLVALGSEMFTGPYTFASRFEQGAGTNPEELLGAAHASCFSMFLANVISGAGKQVTSVRTTASVTLGDGPAITGVALSVTAEVPGLSEADFAQHVKTTEAGCPISAALSVPITVDARLS